MVRQLYTIVIVCYDQSYVLLYLGHSKKWLNSVFLINILLMQVLTRSTKLQIGGLLVPKNYDSFYIYIKRQISFQSNRKQITNIMEMNLQDHTCSWLSSVYRMRNLNLTATNPCMDHNGSTSCIGKYSD